METPLFCFVEGVESPAQPGSAQLKAVRLPAALARFLVQLQADGRSPHTVAQYQLHARRFASWLEAEQLPHDVAQLEPEHVTRVLASCTRWGQSRAGTATLPELEGGVSMTP